MSKLSRTKGHNYERDVAKLYRETGFAKAQRQLEYQEGLGVDLEHTGPFDVQCKVGKRPPTPWVALEEIPENKPRVPVAHLKKDRQKPVVCLYEEDWMQIVAMLNHVMAREIQKPESTSGSSFKLDLL